MSGSRAIGFLTLVGIGVLVLYLATSEPRVIFWGGRFPPLAERQILNRPLPGYEYLVTPGV